MKNAIIYILLILLGCSCIYVWAKRGMEASNSPVSGQTTIADPNYVQNVYEAQERLKAQGWYKGKIDGKWGPETDKAYCNWCAVQDFTSWER